MKTKRIIKDLIFVLAGNGLLALSVALFILPHDILSGGVAGIAVALHPLLHLDTTLIINAMVLGMFVLGCLFLGRSFALKTVISSVVYPMMLTVFTSLVPQLQLNELLEGNRLFQSWGVSGAVQNRKARGLLIVVPEVQGHALGQVSAGAGTVDAQLAAVRAILGGVILHPQVGRVAVQHRGGELDAVLAQAVLHPYHHGGDAGSQSDAAGVVNVQVAGDEGAAVDVQHHRCAGGQIGGDIDADVHGLSVAAGDDAILHLHALREGIGHHSLALRLAAALQLFAVAAQLSINVVFVPGERHQLHSISISFDKLREIFD